MSPLITALRAHLGAIGFALVLVVATTVGFSQAATGNAETIIGTFLMNEPNDVKDGSVLAGARFNLIAFVSHPCYIITNDEQQTCEHDYGISSPLKALIEDGSVAAYLRARGLLAAGAPAASSSVSSAAVQSVSSSSASSDAVVYPPVSSSSEASSVSSISSQPSAYEDVISDYSALYNARGQILWSLCQALGEPDEGRGCYQRNVRLIQRLNVELTADIVR